MASLSRIAGTVKINGQVAARNVVVIKDDPAGREVVAVGQSDSDGTFDISYSGWTGTVIALAIDEYGRKFSTQLALNQGEIVHPETPNGYVYEVTEGGVTGTEEPVWHTESSFATGSVTLNPRPYYRPVASGPLEGEAIAVEYVDFEQFILGHGATSAWLFNEDTGPVVDIVSGGESAFPSGASITRGEPGLPANSSPEQRSYLFSSADTDYIELNQDDSFLQSPVFTIAIAFQLRDYTQLRVSSLVGTSFTGSFDGFWLAYDNRQLSAPNDLITDQAIRFYVSDGTGASVSSFMSGAISDNNPHLLAVVYDGLVFRLFIDGVLVDDSKEMPGNGPTDISNILVGNGKGSGGTPGTGSCPDGHIDTFAIWDGEVKSDQWVADLAAKFFEERPA